MIISAIRVVAMWLSALISGIGLAWTAALGKKYPDVLKGLRTITMIVAAVIVGVPLVMYLVSFLHA